MDELFDPAWLPQPETTLFAAPEPDRFEAAYVALRRGKASRVIQPDRARLVFVYVAQDGFPIGIKMLEPAPGTIKAFILNRLISVTNGDEKPRVAPYRFGRCAPDELVDAAFVAITEASARLAS